MTLYHEDGHPLFLKDVFESLKGKRVLVFTASSAPIAGTLVGSNGYLVELNSEIGLPEIYIPIDKVVAVGGEPR